MIFNHKSVLLNETVDSLCVKPQGIYVDGTLGGGGHASEVAARLGDGGRLIGIDQDADAIAAASERLAPFGDKITVVRSNYERIAQVLEGNLPIGYCLFPQCEMVGIKLKLYNFKSTLFPL